MLSFFTNTNWSYCNFSCESLRSGGYWSVLEKKKTFPALCFPSCDWFSFFLFFKQNPLYWEKNKENLTDMVTLCEFIIVWYLWNQNEITLVHHTVCPSRKPFQRKVSFEPANRNCPGPKTVKAALQPIPPSRTWV